MELILISIATFIASVIGTISGFGSSTILLPLLLLAYSLPESLLLAGIIHVFSDIWQVVLFKKKVRWKIALEFGVFGVFASVAGALLVLSIPEGSTELILGVFFIAYALFLYLHPHMKIMHEARMASLGGAISGFSAGIFGLGGAMRAAFLSTFNLPKESYIATIGVIALMSDVARVSTYAAGGIDLGDVLLYGLALFIPISFLGALAARKIVHKISQDTFKNIIK